MAFYKIIGGAASLLTVSAVGGIAIKSSNNGASVDAPIQVDVPGSPPTESRGPESTQSVPEIKSMNSVTPRTTEPKHRLVTYSFTNGSTKAALTCPEGVYPWAGHDSQKDVIICQSDTKQHSIQWFALKTPAPNCELVGSTNSYTCSSKQRKLTKIPLTGKRDSKNKEGIQIS
ncbi:hypothetical protein MHLP_04150 [Candidatus Mycoplasma haematolamae str. Purdue]|uniref:Uncharacterized protein n=1 Tax=Mycoplasma haematolamae (strain Purdue) TaxID=1212765 RepID=I7BAQ9_MYCHA|nr:hypothetical protein [Candidatus Mycoplasma haematolamae]AFO52410.1 hypothetical protein MHLP_04150 [Candidatus Mycoplasma haematolamae str. Purdue]